VKAALEGSLKDVHFTPHPIFKILVPDEVPGVDPDVLQPERTWDDLEAYQTQARDLAHRFAENFRQFAQVDPAIAAAGPDEQF
ncbi:MAG: phosphoenolpyruvate carboxykinase (ATP), partial [Microcystaceae cyanobacterium]